MANQVYRGNSEQKLYQVINNFVGGMNTVDVDEVVASNEFRELVNVDLSKYGMLQNRKGFALSNNLNELFQNALLSDVFQNEILHIEIIRDDINLLETVSSFETIDDFKNAYRFKAYEFRAFIVTKKLDSIQFNDLIVLNDGGPVDYTDWEHYADVVSYDADIILGSTKYKVKPTRLTGVKSTRLGNLIFISASEFLENGDFIIQLRYEDSGVIGENSTRITFINNNQNYYETTPYDIETEGHNLLAANPLLNVKQLGTLQNIRGITLVKKNGTNYYALDNIPTDGQFTALVMHTGVIPVSNIVVRVYYYNTLGTLVEYERNKDYIMTFNDTLADGILTFDFDFSKIERRDVPIQIEFNVVDSGDIETYQTFSDLTELNEYYNFTITTKNDDVTGIFVPYFYEDGVSPSEYHLWENISTYVYNDLGRLYTTPQAPSSIGEFTYYLEGDGLVKKYYGTIFAKVLFPGQTAPSYFQWNGSTWAGMKTEAEYNAATFKRTYDISNWGSVTISGYPNTTTGIVNFLKDITTVSNLQKRIPSNIVGTVKVGTTSYIWNETFLGDETDFVTYGLTDITTSNFTLVTQFGVTENLEPIKGLDLTNVKITSMNNNLVIYSGNTLWYSVDGNPNYFPYKNYVQLPLLGNDEIISINYFRGTYMVFTKERIYRISGYFPDITVTLVNDSIGCLDAGSIRSFNNTLVFLTYDGLYRLKQNYYLEGLENVEKIDDKINNLFKRTGKFESILYKETYLLFVENESFDTLKYYYNINLPNGYHPFTVDKYAIKPNNLFKVNGEMYSIKNGSFYKYDEGYTDFLPDVILPTAQQYLDSTYRVKITTPNMLFAHPTHDKKFKNMFIKTHTVDNVPLYITTYVNDLLDIDPHKYYTQMTMLGEVEYVIEDLVTIETTTDTSEFGNFELGLSKLGKLEMNVHKVPLSSKGKYIQISIEQNLPAYFGIQDIGIVYKLNKIRAYK